MIKNEDTYCTVQHKIVRELGAWEAVVYATIANLLRKTDGYGNVSNDTLIDLIGRDKKSIYRWIDSLIKAGYLEKVGGKGRGNISIYYITKKGGNMTPFNEEKKGQIDTEKGSNMTEKGGKLTPFEEEKRGQIDTEKGANMTEKGGYMPPINKGIIKEINKGGDSPTPLFETFEEFWNLFNPVDFEHERENCIKEWLKMSQEWREKILEQLRGGLRWRKKENDNPIWYLRDYQGQDAKGELPFMRQGTPAFTDWINDAKRDGKKIIVVRYKGETVHCLASDWATMEKAGSEFLSWFN